MRRCGFRFEKQLRAIGLARIAGIDEAGRGALAGPVVAAAVVLYVSLRSLDGKVAGLLLGIALALIALFVEAVRLFRGWSA